MTLDTLTYQTSRGACSGTIQLSDDDFASCVGFRSASTNDRMAVWLATGADLLANRHYKLRVTTAAQSDAGKSLETAYTSAGFDTFIRWEESVPNPSGVAYWLNYHNQAANEKGGPNSSPRDYEEARCQLSGPLNVTASPGQPLPTITGALTPASNIGFSAFFGIGPVTENPETRHGWTFWEVPADAVAGGRYTFSTASLGAIAPQAPGNYRYVFAVRTVMDAVLGSDDYSPVDIYYNWTFCDSDPGAGYASNSTFELENLGVLTVTP